MNRNINTSKANNNSTILVAFLRRIVVFLEEFLNPDPAVRASWRYQVRRIQDFYQIDRLIYRISALGAGISLIAGIWEYYIGQQQDSRLYGGVFVVLVLVSMATYSSSNALAEDYRNVLSQIVNRQPGMTPVIEHPLYDAEIARQNRVFHVVIRVFAVLLAFGLVLAIVSALIVEHEWLSSYPAIQQVAEKVVEYVNACLNDLLAYIK